jgi:hypothetical protein
VWRGVSKEAGPLATEMPLHDFFEEFSANLLDLHLNNVSSFSPH